MTRDVISSPFAVEGDRLEYEAVFPARVTGRVLDEDGAHWNYIFAEDIISAGRLAVLDGGRRGDGVTCWAREINERGPSAFPFWAWLRYRGQHRGLPVFEFDAARPCCVCFKGIDVTGPALPWVDDGGRWAASDLSGSTGALVVQDGTPSAGDAGAAGQVLTSNGPGVAPTFQASAMTGPASSTDNALARFDGTTGKAIQNSAATLSDAGRLTVTYEDAGTATAAQVLELVRNTSGAPAAGIAGALYYYVENADGPKQLAAIEQAGWGDVGPAAEFSIWQLYTVGPGGASRLTIYADGSGGARIGFLGASPAARQTGDAGTALVTFGLMSGMPTFNAANLTGTAPASVLPVFVGAGASAAKGAVPSPGATDHSNQPYYLGDEGAWVAPLGRLLGRSLVATEQSTTSAAPADLTTVQSFSVTLDETTDVLILGWCTTFNGTSGANNTITLDVGGTDTTLQTIEMFGSNKPMPMFGGTVRASLAAGTHTFKLQFSTNAGTASFKDRGLVALRAS